MVQFRKPFQRFLAHFLTWFFKLLYTRLAWTYDLVSFTVSLGHWNQWVRSVIQLTNGEPILELGHGPGHLQTALLSAGFRPFGMDLSAQMGRTARQQILKMQLTQGISSSNPLRLARAQAQSLPFLANSFQTILATFPTPYIVHPDTVREIQRVLLPGGRAVILLTAWITGKNILDTIARWLFLLTHQVPPPGMDYAVFLEPFQLTGQHAELIWLEPDGARLLFVQIVKENPADSETC
jgi:ubiquinone/menaquinone biosynthesis C-methylase UbiE